MTESEANGVIDFVGKLYPKLDWADEMIGEFVRRVRWLDITSDQAEAALRDQLMQAKGFKARKPEASDIFERLAKCVNKPTIAAVIEVPRYHPDRPPATGWNQELAARFDANPEDPIFDRLRAKGISVYVATRGMRGTANSQAEREMAAL